MSRVRVKVCGFTQAEDIAAAVDLGVDAFGFNLAAGPRRLEPDQAAALARLVPPPLGVVALVMDQDVEQTLALVARLRASAVQLHGAEPPHVAEALARRVPVIKAFRIRAVADLHAAVAYPADVLLLDAYSPTRAGGSGCTWDHSLLSTVAIDRRWMLAGGITPENAAAAIAALAPWAIDVASGVEDGQPGRKSRQRMAALMAAAGEGGCPSNQ